MAKETSVAPKERINIKYVPATGDQQAEIELPLKMLVLGDFKGHAEDTPLEDREAVRVDKNTFNSVMEKAELSAQITVPNHLVESEEDVDMPIDINFSNLADFGPDNIAKNVPELKKLLDLREALTALKGPMGNVPAFRNKLQDIIKDENSRDQLEKELGMILDNEEE
jgi:type VI secretion system protein ImpB